MYTLYKMIPAVTRRIFGDLKNKHCRYYLDGLAHVQLMKIYFN